MTEYQLLDAARSLALAIQPVNDATRKARERILLAADAGRLEAVAQAIIGARVPYRIRRGKPVGVMTVDVMGLADVWLAEYRGSNQEMAA